MTIIAVLSKTTKTVLIAAESYYTTITFNWLLSKSATMQLYIMAPAVLSKTTKTVSIVAVCFLLYYYNLYRIGYSYTICFYGALSAPPPPRQFPNHGTRHICTSESTPYPLVRTTENCVRTELLEDRQARLADGQTTEIRSGFRLARSAQT